MDKLGLPVVKNLGGRPVGSGAGRRVVAVKGGGGNKKKAKETMLALTNKLLAGSGDAIIAKIIAKALNDDDKDQAAMLKLCLDRIAPASAFEKASTAANKVEVVVSLVSSVPVVAKAAEDAIDVEAREVNGPEADC